MHSRTFGAPARALTLTLLLAGCGGGTTGETASGTDDGPPDRAPPPPVSSLPTLGSPVVIVSPPGAGIGDLHAALEKRSGTVFALWTEGAEGRGGLYLSRYVEGNGFWDPAPVRVDDGSGTAIGVSAMVVDDKGSVLVLWSEGDGDRYRLRSRYRPFSAGGAWHAPYYASDTATAHTAPLMVAERRNRFIVSAWTEPAATTRLRSNRYDIDLDGTWEGMTTLDDGSGDVSAVTMAIDDDDVTTLAWLQEEQSSGLPRRRLWFARNNPANGAWSAAAPVAPDSGGDISQARLATLPGGGLVALWLLDDGLRTSLLTSRYGAGEWSTPEPLDDGGEASSPQLVVDGDGNVTAIWSERDTNGRITLLARRHHRTDRSWGGVEILAQTTHRPILPDRLLVDDEGNVTALWRQADSEGRLDLWSNRHAHASGWGEARLIERYDEGDAGPPLAALDGNGNLTVLWRHWHEGGHHLLASRYRVATDRWDPPAKIDHPGHHGAQTPRLVVAENGTATVLWRQPGTEGESLWANRF